ncbi:MAG: hypothetical protein AAFY15_13530, partial [Cyanobacteria bacterium J06648_11]
RAVYFADAFKVNDRISHGPSAKHSIHCASWLAIAYFAKTHSSLNSELTRPQINALPVRDAGSFVIVKDLRDR